MGYGHSHRQKAAALGAADAKALLGSSLPFVLKLLTPAQLQQVQKVMDAAVLNPVIKKEYEDLMRRSVRSQSGSVVLRDENIVNRANRVFESMIPIDPSDYRIRLDFTKLITSDALNVTTGNPDEAAYLEKIKKTLKDRGVWLRIGQPYVRDSDDPSARKIDPKTFEVWLSVGPDGDTIATRDGQLTRDALLRTNMFGAGYWREVHQGPVQKALVRQMARLQIEIEAGRKEHLRLILRKTDASFAVPISDTLGGADLPNQSIWDVPHKLLVEAMEMNARGNIKGARVYLLAAAIITRNNAQALAQYADDSELGAGRAIVILEVVKTVSEITDIVLAGVGAVAVIRSGARAGAEIAAEEAADAALAERVAAEHVKKNRGIDLTDKVTRMRGPKGTKLGGAKHRGNSGLGGNFQEWP